MEDKDTCVRTYLSSLHEHSLLLCQRSSRALSLSLPLSLSPIPSPPFSARHRRMKDDCCSRLSSLYNSGGQCQSPPPLPPLTFHHHSWESVNFYKLPSSVATSSSSLRNKKRRETSLSYDSNQKKEEDVFEKNNMLISDQLLPSRIQQERVRRGWTQKDLANRVYLHWTIIRDMENVPSIRMMKTGGGSRSGSNVAKSCSNIGNSSSVLSPKIHPLYFLKVKAYLGL